MSRRISSRRASPEHRSLLHVCLAASAACLLSCARSEEAAQKTAEAEPAQVVQKAAPDPCPIAAGVDKDITLYKRCSPYMQPGGGIDVVNGATLTIEAGVELRFKDKDWMEIGAGGEPGRLIAKGTAEDPIILTTESPETEPTWLGLWFHSGTLEGSVLSHAIVRRGGGDNRHSKPNLLHGCVTLTGVKPGNLSIDELQVEKCVNGGVRMTNSQVQLGAVRFVDTGQGFVVDAGSAGQITKPGVYEGVTHNLIRGGTVTADARWLPQPVPYLVEGDITVQGPGAPTLTLLPGLELRFGESAALRVGVDQAGSLQAEGTREAPIKLTSITPEGRWQGVQFMSQTGPGTKLAFVEVSETKSDAAVAVHSKPGRVDINHSKFSRNAADVLVGCDAKPELADNRYASQRGLTRKSACK